MKIEGGGLMARYSLGIDIGNEKIALAYCRGTGRNVKVAAWAMYSLEKDKPLNEKLNGVTDLVSDFMAENRIGGATCAYVGIPAETAILREIGFPSVVRENLGTTLGYEMEKYIPVPVDHLYFDHQIIEEDKKTGRLKVLVAATKKKDVGPYLDVANRLGNIYGVEPGPVALTNFLAFAKDGKTSTSELAAFLRLKPEGAAFEEAVTKANLPSGDFAPAFGLALKGIWDAPVRINLLPMELRKKPSRAGRYVMVAFLAFAVLAALAWGGAGILRQRIELRELVARNQSLSAEMRDYDKTVETIEELEKSLKYLNSLRLNHVPVSDMLRELSLIIPESAWVRDFRLKKNEIHLTGEAEVSSELIPVLEASPLFREVHFSSPIIKVSDGREKYKIALKLHSKPGSMP